MTGAGTPVTPNYSGGYVRLFRKLLDNPVWALRPHVLKVMLTFLLKANWKPKLWPSGKITIQRGSFVTSFRKMATLCHISVKESRSAFDHLEALEFAQYHRLKGRKWTLVTVLNYDLYQVAPDPEMDTEMDPETGPKDGHSKGHSNGHSEGTVKGTVTGTVNTPCKSGGPNNLRQPGPGTGHTNGHAKEHETGTQNRAKWATTEEEKNIRTNTTPPYPLKGDGAGELFDTENPPFSTLDPEPNGQPYTRAAIESSDPKPGPEQKTVHPAIARVARSIHDRHPAAHGRRDCSVSAVEKKLAAILKHKHTPKAEWESYLSRIDRNHAAVCESDDWQKSDGQFAKSLRNWLAPSEERYDVEPPTSENRPLGRIL